MIKIKLIKEITDEAPDVENVEDLQHRILGVHSTWEPSSPEGKTYKKSIGDLLGLKEEEEEGEISHYCATHAKENLTDIDDYVHNEGKQRIKHAKLKKWFKE